METKELRIGNYVQSKSGKNIYKITEISEHHLNLSNGTDVFSNHGCEVYPIALTRELLLKCGFETIPHLTVMNSLIFKLGRNRELSLGCVGTPNEALFLCQVDNEENTTEVLDIICLHNFDYDGKLYLHKLQNICYDLGKELTLEPF